MADAYKTLYRAQPAALGPAVIYTAPSAVIIKHMSFLNANAAMTFGLFRNGLTAAHLISPSVRTSVSASGSVEFDGTISLESGGTIAIEVSVINQLTVVIDGDEVS